MIRDSLKTLTTKIEKMYILHNHGNFQEDEFIEEKFGPKGKR